MTKTPQKDLTVLVTGARAPSALHVARIFHLAGARVIASDCISHSLTRADRSKYQTRRHPSPSREPQAFRDWLIDVCETCGVGVIFPTCEEVFHVAQALKGTKFESLVFAPSFDMLLAAHSKANFPEMLRKAGLEFPRTIRIERQTEIKSFGKPLEGCVLKPEFSRFATSTLVRPTREEAMAISVSPQTPWVVQEVLEGEELCCYGIASQGRLLALSSYRSLYRAGRGAGTYFEPVSDEGLHTYASGFTEATGWTGQFAFDVIMTKDRGPVAIECNPRATSGIHFLRDPKAFLEMVMEGASCGTSMSPLMIGPAVRTSGLMQALRGGSHNQWRQDLRKAEEAVVMEGFGLPLWQMLRTSLEFGILSRRKKISLLEATTEDIAWDG